MNMMQGEDQLSMQQDDPNFYEFDQGDVDQQQQEPSMQHSIGDPELGEVAMTVGAVSQGDPDESQTQGRKSKQGQVDAVDHTRSGWSKRTEKMLHVLSRQFDEAEEGGGEADEEPQLEFLTMLGTDASRKVAATTFFELLVLKSTNFIDVEQANPYGEIVLTKTDEFTSQPISAH